MKDNQKECLAITLEYEGGWSNHPKDPGGATMNGVTQRVYDAYRRNKGKPERSVRNITETEKFEIYDQQYWDRVQGDRLPKGVDLVVFDYAVNSGVSRSAKELQRVLGVTVDGVVGDITIDAAKEADPVFLINEVCDQRLGFLKRLKTWSTFGRGWERRVAGIRASALAMTGPTAHPRPTVTVDPTPAPGHAPESDIAPMKTAEGMGLTTAAIGAGGQAIFSSAQSIQPHMGETILGRAAIAGFILLAVIGAILIGYSYYKRIKEAGGLGGYLNAKAQRN